VTLANSILRAVSLLGLGSGVFLLAYRIACAPTVAPNMHGLRGARRLSVLRASPLFAQAEPMIRWLAVRLRPLLPEQAYEKLARQLMLAGDFLGLAPEEFLALTLMSCAAGVGTGLAYAALLGKSLLYPILVGLLGAALPYLELSGREHERRRQVSNGLPHAVDLIALGLSAGLDFPAALRQLVEKSSRPDDPLLEEFGFMLQSLELGKTRKEALTEFAQRVPTESVREFVFAIIQAEERGNPLGRVLSIQAEVSRQHRSQRAEEAAARASVKIMGPLVLMFAAILLLMVAPMVFELKQSFLAD
jgi:tight adherence protein C